MTIWQTLLRLRATATLVIGADYGCLVTAFSQLADLPDPQCLAKKNTSLGESHLYNIVRHQSHRCRLEFFFRPIFSLMFVVCLTGDSFVTHPFHKAWTVPFAIKYKSESMKIRRLRLKSCRLRGNLRLQTGDNLLFQYLQQSWVNLFVDHEKRLAIHGIDPIIGSCPQT